MKLNIHSVSKYVCIAGIIAMGIWLLLGISFSADKVEETTVQLDELNDGVYAIYYTTHSSVPAQNYEVVTLNCDGNIQTFKGKVTISYTNYSPYAEINSYKYLVNADEIHIYVPQGSVEYQTGVNISK